MDKKSAHLLIQSSLECLNYSREALTMFEESKNIEVITCYINLANQSLKIGQTFFLENFEDKDLYEYGQFYRQFHHFSDDLLKSIANVKPNVNPSDDFKNLKEYYAEIESRLAS